MFRNSFAYILLISVALLGMAAISYATVWGPIIVSDSVAYLTVARNILVGDGVGVYEASGQFSVNTLQPPFYPFLLAFFGLSGMNLVPVTRWLHALFFGLMVFLFGLALMRLTSSRLLALAGALSLLASSLLLDIFSRAMTEPTFILLSLFAALCLERALGHGRLGWLVIAAVCVGLSAITRYVGVAWIVSGSLMVMIFWPGNWKQRLSALFYYGGFGALPLVVWIAWTEFIVEGPSRTVNSSVNLAQRSVEARMAIVSIFWKWLPFSYLLPDVHYRVKLLGLSILAGLWIALTLVAVWKVACINSSGNVWRQDPVFRSFSLLWLSLLSYISVVVFGYIYSKPTPDLNERTLLIGMLIGLSLTYVTCGAVNRAFLTHRTRHVFPLVCAGILIATTGPHSFKMLKDYHREGEGYLSSRWRSSPTRLAAMGLSPDIPLISNEHSALSFWLGRPVYPLPEVVYLSPEPLNVPFGERAEDEIQQVFREQGAALVIFNTIRWQLDGLYFEQTPERLEGMVRDLSLYGDYHDGAIYFYPVK